MFKDSKSDRFVKSGAKRGVDIGVHVNLPTKRQKFVKNFENLEDMLDKALSGRLENFNVSECPQCDEEEEREFPVKRIVKPAYKCDEWDFKYRICILQRNIGDTVTFYLSTGSHRGRKLNITWMKEFHVRDSNTRKEFVIDPEDSPENIFIGRRGYELRVSPVTEIDLGFNMFSATLHGHAAPYSKVYFMIRVVPIDLGFVYVGETVELSLRSYGSLPAVSMTFKWYMEKDGEHGTLPSNMKMSESSIKISELREEQEGILACSVYTNLDILATRKRFLMKNLIKNNNVLESAPNHSLVFKEAFGRAKRDPPKHTQTKPRSKRETDFDVIVENALLESTTTEETPKLTATQASDNDLEIDTAPTVKNYGDSPQRPENYEIGFQEVIGNADENENIPPANDIDFSVGNGPEEVEQQYTHGLTEGNSQPMYTNEGFPKPAEGSVGHGYQPTMGKTGMINRPLNQYPINQKQIIADKRAEYRSPQVDLEFQSGDLLKPSTHRKTILQQSMTNPGESIKKQYVGINIQNKKATYAPPSDNSNIILNIDRISQRRKNSTEERIAKLISSCFSDYECSESAICIRPNLKERGFCKCLPGFFGVGIFCRKDIWMSNSQFNVEDLHSLKDVPYSK